MEDKAIKLTEQEVDSIIFALKSIDVRGFESMDRLVAMVMFFQNKKSAMEAAKALEVKGNGTN